MEMPTSGLRLPSPIAPVLPPILAVPERCYAQSRSSHVSHDLHKNSSFHFSPDPFLLGGLKKFSSSKNINPTIAPFFPICSDT